MRKRIQYSQNFLKSKKLIKGLIEKSSIGQDDIVYEIGAGQGIITNELVNYCKKVVAIEVDRNLYLKLKQRFERHSDKVELRLGNFIEYALPNQRYKIFSNIPFNITSDIIKKITLSNNSPIDSYLIVQKEAAKKFSGKPFASKNSLMSILIKARFEMEIFHNFNKSNFFPKPSVETVMLRIKKLKEPLVARNEIDLYNDFVTYTFSQFESNILKGLSNVLDKQVFEQLAKDKKFSTSHKPSQLEVAHWLALFETFLQHSNETQKRQVRGSFKKLLEQQNKLQKIHRTRLDNSWRQHNK